MAFPRGPIGPRLDKEAPPTGPPESPNAGMAITGVFGLGVGGLTIAWVGLHDRLSANTRQFTPLELARFSTARRNFSKVRFVSREPIGRCQWLTTLKYKKSTMNSAKTGVLVWSSSAPSAGPMDLVVRFASMTFSGETIEFRAAARIELCDERFRSSRRHRSAGAVYIVQKERWSGK